ncbi:MAG: hypothetical protein DRQ13_11755 [Ignavibacteriae bacterium]|nr:MAG: hypothetical protein DRQ13_11755 [Ignavibacteriota bacterium]
MNKITTNNYKQFFASPIFGLLILFILTFSSTVSAQDDENGVMLMLKAGYKKSGAVSFFEKLEMLEKEYGVDQRDALNDFISSHPTARERRDRVINLY